MLTQAEQNVLNTNLPMLETDFPYDRLYAEMVSSGILDESDKSKLNAEQNNIKRNRRFFDLIQSKPTGTFQRVCQLFSQLSTVNASIGVQLLHAIHQQASTETTDQCDAPMASLDGTQQVNVGKDDQKIQLEVKHHDDDAKDYFNLILKTEIPNDRKAINIREFSLALGFKWVQVKAILTNSDRSVVETLQEVFDKWCNEMRKEAIKATFVKALYKAGLVDAAKLVASSSVSGSNQ